MILWFGNWRLENYVNDWLHQVWELTFELQPTILDISHLPPKKKMKMLDTFSPNLLCSQSVGTWHKFIQWNATTITFELGAIVEKKDHGRFIPVACGGSSSNNTEFPGMQGQLCSWQHPVFDHEACWEIGCAMAADLLALTSLVSGSG